ncbi:hypothetical protein Tco_0069347, partial [Tanacetum coccineum]
VKMVLVVTAGGGGGDDGVGCGGTTAEEEGEGKSVSGASGVDGRVDRVTRKLFEAHRKTPPEKFSGGGAMVAGGGGGGVPEFMGRERPPHGVAMGGSHRPKGCLLAVDDLDKLWSLVKERFSSTDPTDDKERTL